MQRIASEKKLIILILSALAIQIAGRYYSKPFMIDGFDTLKFVLVFLLPLVICRWGYQWSFKDIGVSWPKYHRFAFLLTAILLGVATIAVLLATQSADYLEYYHVYRKPTVGLYDRVIHFTVFTLSTITGWELLHRGVLLFGIRKLLVEMKVKLEYAGLIAALWVVSLEAIYHLIKPDSEAWGMLGLSLILSFIALRTRSILIPMGVHLLIEVLFFYSITRGT